MDTSYISYYSRKYTSCLVFQQSGKTERKGNGGIFDDEGSGLILNERYHRAITESDHQAHHASSFCPHMQTNADAFGLSFVCTVSSYILISPSSVSVFVPMFVVSKRNWLLRIPELLGGIYNRYSSAAHMIMIGRVSERIRSSHQVWWG